MSTPIHFPSLVASRDMYVGAVANFKLPEKRHDRDDLDNNNSPQVAISFTLYCQQNPLSLGICFSTDEPIDDLDTDR